MLIVINQLTVTPEHRADFEAAFAANLRDRLGDVPGLRHVSLLRPRRPDQPYLAVIELTDEKAFAALRSSPGFAAAHAVGNRDIAQQKPLGTYDTAAELTPGK